MANLETFLGGDSFPHQIRADGRRLSLLFRGKPVCFPSHGVPPPARRQVSTWAQHESGNARAQEEDLKQKGFLGILVNITGRIFRSSVGGDGLVPPSLLNLSITVLFTKASEASWSYSCDSKVSFDRVQILTPDFSGRRPPPLPSAPLPSSPLPSPLSPPHLPSPPPCFPPTFPPSLPPSSLFASSTPSCLAAALAHSHCLTVSLISLISLISFSSLSSLSPLSLSLSSLSLVFPSLFSLFSRRRIRAKSHI